MNDIILEQAVIFYHALKKRVAERVEGTNGLLEMGKCCNVCFMRKNLVFAIYDEKEKNTKVFMMDGSIYVDSDCNHIPCIDNYTIKGNGIEHCPKGGTTYPKKTEMVDLNNEGVCVGFIYDFLDWVGKEGSVT